MDFATTPSPVALVETLFVAAPEHRFITQLTTVPNPARRLGLLAGVGQPWLSDWHRPLPTIVEQCTRRQHGEGQSPNWPHLLQVAGFAGVYHVGQQSQPSPEAQLRAFVHFAATKARPPAEDKRRILEEASIAYQQLTRSERPGCALGALAASLADWPTLAKAIATALKNCNAPAEAQQYFTPNTALAQAVQEALTWVSATSSGVRALVFGAEQARSLRTQALDVLEALAEEC